MKYIVEGTIVDQYETKNYYYKYIIVALKRYNTRKFDFLIKNNNENTMKNIKIVLKTEKKNKIFREMDFPDLPPSSTFTVRIPKMGQETESLFKKNEYGDYIIFEYRKDNLYADEKYILEEPLYISLQEENIIEIEYTIFSENLQKINGVLEVNMDNEAKEITPLDVFCKL